MSACIIAMDEADRIADCIRSLDWCDEVLVVDSHSSDATREVAAEHGARVIERDWPGHVAQKEFTVRAAEHDWVFCIDADERVSDELRAELVALRDAGFPGHVGWRCPRRSFHLGGWIRHGTWYPDRQLRLFDRRRGRWGGHDPHDRVELEEGATVGALRGDLLHHPYRSLSEHLATIDRYTTTMAAGLVERGRRVTLWDVVTRPPMRFLGFYLTKLGILDGWRGFVLACLAAHYCRMKYVKAYLMQRESSGAGTASTGGTALGLVLLVALLAGCAPERPARPYELYANLRLADELTVELPGALLASARALPPSTHARLALRYVEAGSAGSGPRLLLGTPQTAGVDAALAALGVVVEDASPSMRFAGSTDLPGFDLLVATCADPERPGYPLGLVVATAAEALEPWLRRASAGAQLSFRAFERGDLVARGRLDLEGRRNRVIVPRRGALRAGAERREGRGIELRGDAACAPLLDDYLRELRRARKTLLELTGSPKRQPPVIEVRAFGHFEDLAVATDSHGLSARNPVTGAVHAYLSETLHDAGAGYARSLAHELLGPPSSPWVEQALAVHAAGAWWGRPLEAWVARLAAAGLVPESSSQVLAPGLPEGPGEVSGPRLSEHLCGPLRAAFLAYLLEGGADLRELWSAPAPSGSGGPGPDAAWVAFRASLEVGALGDPSAERGARSARLAARGFLRGANLVAPRGGAPELGFGTRAARRSLAQLRGAGANAVAVCYDAVAFASGPRPAFEPAGAGPLVPDLGLLVTLQDAADAELGVMLRPFLLETPSGAFAGEHAEESEARHARFFDHYGAALVHAALLAELGGAEILCVGSALPRATRTDPTDDPWIPDFTNENTGRWTELIATVRGIFAGSLTYAADGLGEGERVEFWPELDFVGRELFRPLGNHVPDGSEPDPDPDAGSDQDWSDPNWSDPAWPDMGSLRRKLIYLLEETVALGAEVERPALLVEVGFPGSAEGWRRPGETQGDPDLDEQARLFEALMRALHALDVAGALDASPGQGRLAGLFLWCWSTDPDAGRVEDESHTPQNRPALQQVKRLFRIE